MNLHQIVAPYISAVNPMLDALIRISVGSTMSRDGVRTPRYATPGAFMGSIAGTTLTVRTVNEGVLQPGQLLADESNQLLLAGTMITRVIDAPDGGPGTYEVSREQTVPLELMQTSLVVPAQVQPMTFRDLQQVEGLNLGGQKQSIYINGDINNVVRISLKGGDLVDLPDGTWLVVQQLEGFHLTAGWTKAAIVLQNGS